MKRSSQISSWNHNQLLVLQLLLWVYYSTKKAAVKGKLTSSAKCVTDIMYGGNHTRSSERLLKQGAIYAGFLGTIPNWKGQFCTSCMYQPALPSCRLIHSVLAAALGKHLMHGKTSGGEEIGKEKLSPPKSKLHLFRMTHIHKRGKIWNTVYHRDSHQSQSHRNLEFLHGLWYLPFSQFRMDPGAYFYLLDWCWVRKRSHFGQFVSEDSDRNHTQGSPEA